MFAIRKQKRRTILGVFILLVILTVIFTSLLWRIETVPEIATRHSWSEQEEILSALNKFSVQLRQINIQVILIEPPVLFRMLTQSKQDALLAMGYNLTKMSSNVISVATRGRQDIRLSLPSVNFRLESAGFAFIGKEIKDPTPFAERLTKLSKNPLVTHFLYGYQGMIIHIVVFFERDNYAWHGNWKMFPLHLQEKVDFKHLPFTESDGLYDKFTITPFPENGRFHGLYAPGTIEHFLLQVPTSRMVECLSGQNWNDGNETLPTNSEGAVPKEVFEKTAASVLHELKSVLEPLITPFWLASGTLLGWYRNCDILPYTSDVDFATWRTDTDLSDTFKRNQNIQFLASLGQPDEDLEFWLMYQWLRVDLFFTYQDKEHFWVGGHNPSHGYSFKYFFPRFTLCSGVFLGYKVNIPCEVDSVLKTEYGSGWRTPVTQWNYEMSARNVLGRRYWTSREKRDFHKQS